jgi:hypothetical protein
VKKQISCSFFNNKTDANIDEGLFELVCFGIANLTQMPKNASIALK